MKTKVYKFFAVSFAIAALLSFTTGESGRIQDNKHLIYIYATNDIHGTFFDSTYNGVIQTTSFSKVSFFIKKERELKGEDAVVLLDVGDNLQGDNSVFYYNYIDTSEINLVPEVFNYLRYDAVVIGNHDIETGHNVYDKVRKELKMPYLAANAVYKGSQEPYFIPYTVIKRGGIKIAVIGLTNANIKKWLSPSLYEGIEFTEAIPVLERYIRKIRQKETPDIMIVAMHAGLGDEKQYQLEDPSKFVAANVKGIDMVFAAHDHRSFAGYVWNGRDSIPVVEGGSRTQNLSCGTIELVCKNSKVVVKKVTPSVIPLINKPSDPDYNQFLSTRFKAVKSFTNNIIGYIDKGFSSKDAYFGSSEYVDMIHSLQLEYTSADISFAAPLSYNINFQAGNINFLDLMNLYPFENLLYTITLSGKEIKNYLEYSYQKWVNKVSSPEISMLIMEYDENGKVRLKNMHFNFDSAAGIIYEVDITKGDGERVNIKSMADGTQFDMNKTYRVAVSSYRASGGGDLLTSGAGIPFEELDNRVVSRMKDIRGLIYEKLKREGKLSSRKLNTWKFIPEQLVLEKMSIEKEELFQ
ncbi:MAG: bifunctional UDP-sugar hydrolase/5'-nucleotidase [Rikenellaceae bacterium]|nr:bifunctional UDP-sugar hydrolase/5'-nucleotidase [Rikenellaceae bacterium]